ncbi:MAG: ABC transporter permease [Parasporobacterium sp.]|nr:ABC transporter permease [Parasporobacterium sp.]
MKYILKKLLSLIIALLLISIVVFLAFSVLPADATAAKLGQNATPERIAALRAELGLDRPVMVRYFSWLAGAVQGDFGESYQYTGTKVMTLLGTRIGTSAVLSLISFLMVVIVSVPVGIFGSKRRSAPGRAGMTAVVHITMGIPSFFLGVLITYLFSLVLHWFTIGRYVLPEENLLAAASYLVFPALAIALPKIAMTVKFLITSIRAELHKDYVRTAYAKGCSRNQVFYGHVLKNSLVPVITFMGIIVAEIVAGSIVVEKVFSVPGIGMLLVTAITNRDYPVVEAVVLLIAAVIIVINCLVDIIYKLIDPRVTV